ncbi:hypothetical protein ID866_8792 [Astraeus odoratus]|nr:hypothetical protein ID866_8792 [Astraeus odoratus]
MGHHSSSTPAESWGQPAMTSVDVSNARIPPTRKHAGKLPPSHIVRDDWDADDDENEDEIQQPGEGNAVVGKAVEEENVRIWHDANAKAPMPDLVITPSTTGGVTIALPAAALKPALRILKRPSQSQSQTPALQSPSTSASSSPSTSQRGTLAEREAQYLEARNRIFGVASSPPSLDQSSTNGSTSRPGATSEISDQLNASNTPVITVVRDPLGPPPEPNDDQDKSQLRSGFSERKRGRNSRAR